MLCLSSFFKAVLRTAKRNINKAVTFVLAVILMTGSLCGYLAPAVNAEEENNINHPNNMSASSWFAGEPKKAKTKARKAPSGQLRSAPTGDVPLDSYITGVTASGTTKIEDNLYQATVELQFVIDTECIEAVKSAGYKFVYDLPKEVVLNEGLISGGPYYAYLQDRYPDLVLAFTYKFIPTDDDGHCRIEIVYDDDFVRDATESGTDRIKNTLSCRCWISSSGDATNDELDVAFTDTQTLHIPPEDIHEDYDITTQKTGSYTADGKLRYEVTVSSVHGTPSDIDVTDTFWYLGGGTVSPPTEISVVKHKADGTIETFSIPAQGHIDAFSQLAYKISLNLHQLQKNEYYTLVYEYGVTGLPDQNAAVSAYNTLEATSTDNNETTSDHADYFIYNKQPQKVEKDGIPFDEYVQWYISVNDRGSDIAGKVIYDDGFADAQNETITGINGVFVQRGWADATLGVDYEFVYNNDNKIIGVRFLPANGSTPNNNTYHITYYTLPDVAYGETAIVHNDAEFDGDTVSYDVAVTGGDIDKTADGEQSLGNDLHGMNWTISVQIPSGGIQSGTSFSDTLSPDGHYMTQAQYDALVSALQTAWRTNVSVTPVYTGNNITGYTFTVGTAGNGYLFNDGKVKKITWQYQTTGDMRGKVTESFVNTFSDRQKTLPVINNISPNVKKLNVQKKSEWQTTFSEEPNSLSFNYEDKDKSFVWIAQITPTPGLQQYHVIDTLPEGVELIGVKVMPTPLTAYNYGINVYRDNLLTIGDDGAISGEIGNLWQSKTSAKGQLSTSTEGRQVVDITLNPKSDSSDLFNNTFYVIYYCQLAEDAWPDNGTVHLELNNIVRVQTNGVDYGEADNQINIDATKKKKIVDKSSSWDKNLHMLNYTVDINPSAENLLTGSGGTDDPQWLLLTDVLTYTARQGTGTGEAILSLNSVQLEKEENGVWSVLNNIQWTAHTKTDPVDPNVKKQAFIEMQIPDSTHLRLTYSYKINSSMDSGITLTNSATLEGHGDESGDDNTHIGDEDFETFGESTFEEFWLIKTDKEDGRPLPNAVFTVYTWDVDLKKWVATSKTYTTDSDGKFIIKVTDTYDGTSVYQTDTAYCIMETTAPPGYVLPENPPPFYFWFSKNVSAPQNAPSDFMQSAADISTSSCRIKVGNQIDYDSIPVELTITKNVTGSLGDRTKEFTFTLTVEGAKVTDEYAWSKNGVAQDTPLHNNSTFTLKHGDVVKIMLPRNKDITIKENNLDYSVSMKLDDTAATAGNTKTFQISEDATLAVTNDRGVIVPTGVFHSMNIAAYVIMAICLLIMMSILILRTHKYRPKA